MGQKFTLAVIVTLAAFGDVPASRAALTLEVHPPRIALTRGETARVLIVARNDTERVVTALELGHLAQAGVHVTEIEQFEGELSPGTIHSWMVQVERHDDDRQSELTFYLRATGKSGATDHQRFPAVSDFVTAKLEIELQSSTSADDILGVRWETTHESVQDYRPAQLLLVLENKSEFPVTVTSVSIAHPLESELERVPEFRVSERQGLDESVLQPREQQVCIYDVSTPGRRAPGIRLAVFKIEFEWQEHGQTHRGTNIASQKYELGVLGESALLAMVGVPAFFLLPGFLCLTAFTAVSGRYWRDLPEKVQMSKVEFAASSIALSFLAVPMYSWATGVNYLESYELDDIGRLWLVSLMVGLLASCVLVLVGLVMRLLAVRRERAIRGQEEAREFHEKDSALDVIRKLEKKGLPIARPLATITWMQNEMVVVKLDDDSPGWVCPQIHVKIGPEDWSGRDAWETSFDDVLKQGTGGVAKLLEEAEQNEKITVAFAAKEDIAGPRKLENQPKGGTTPLVILDDDE